MAALAVGIPADLFASRADDLHWVVAAAGAAAVAAAHALGAALSGLQPKP